MPPDCSIKIGLVNDIHYDGGAPAMNRLYEAVASLNQGGAAALVVMGDLVDASGESSARRLLREVAALCEGFRGPVYYMPGNHDLDHLSKEQFAAALGSPGGSPRFRFELGGYRIVCLDGNFSPDGTAYGRGNFRWQEAFVPDSELDWLRAQLASSLLPVVVLSHQRIDVPGTHAVRNVPAVLEILSLSGKVRAVFQGHQHGEDLRRIEGTAFYTLAAHKDGAGPAAAILDPRGVRLARTFGALEPA